MTRACHRHRRLQRASLALALYGYLLWIVPTAHAAHHARFGDDHRHTDAGVVALEPTAETAHAEQHAAFLALGMADVASAGVLAVDCTLADYTLVACPAEGAHAPGFGDLLLAGHRHVPRAPDLEHGRSSLSHLGTAMVVPQASALPPPVSELELVPFIFVGTQHLAVPVRVHPSRGPPARSV